MAKSTTNLLAVGDLILDKPRAESFFEFSAPTLRSGDIVVGQGEVMFTSRGVNTYAEVICNPPCEPANMSAIPGAGFNVITLAANHAWDSGAPGIEDTLNGLREMGIAVAGAGMNIEEARKPAIIERNGTKFGFLNYNCVGPRGTWASPDKPGCAYVQIISHYELEMSNPGGPPTCYTFAEPRSLRAMEDDIRNLRPLCDVLVVVLHKGTIFLADRLEMYEQVVSHAAIDAGANLILGHHSHIMRGVEWYKGSPIFHGLGHFVVAMRSLAVDGKASDRDIHDFRASLGKRFGQEFDDAGDTVSIFPPDSNKTMIARCAVEDGHISRVSFFPCLINKQGQPEVLKRDERGQQVFDYVDRISRKAGLNASYEWDGDEVVVRKL